VAVTIAITHCANPRRDGQAELAWVAGYCPKAVTHPTTNRVQRTATSLIETNQFRYAKTAKGLVITIKTTENAGRRVKVFHALTPKLEFLSMVLSGFRSAQIVWPNTTLPCIPESIFLFWDFS